MTDDLTIYIDEDGSIQHIYDDELADLLADDAAATVTRRASHVEPHPRGGWYADMRPVGGPVLGADGAVGSMDVRSLDDPLNFAVAVSALEPFARRAEALAAERRWLDANMADGRLEAR